jgi:hypothetical protein
MSRWAPAGVPAPGLGVVGHSHSAPVCPSTQAAHTASPTAALALSPHKTTVLWDTTKSNAQLEWQAKEFAVANDIVVTLYGARDVSELSGVLARIPQSALDLLVNLNDPLLFTARKLSLMVRVRCGFRQCTVKAYMPTMVG